MNKALSTPAVSNLIVSSSVPSSTWIFVSLSASDISSVAPLPPESAANVKVPEPSVFNTWPAEPSDVGNE